MLRLRHKGSLHEESDAGDNQHHRVWTVSKDGLGSKIGHCDRLRGQGEKCQGCV